MSTNVTSNKIIKTRLWSAALIAMLVPAVLVGNSGTARSQQAAANRYQEIPIPPKWTDQSPAARNALKERERLVGFIFLGTKPFEENRGDFTEYFTEYYFRLMTHEDHLTELPADREKFTRYLRAPNMQSPQMRPLHDYFVNLIMQSMTVIAKGNYHPVARYNAMLLIGELNSEEAVMIGDNKRQAVPLIEALALMLGELDNPQQIDAVKVACLIGILRHVKIDRELAAARRRLVGNNAQTRIVDVMCSVINQKQAPEDRSQQGHDWMRRRAMEILGELGVPGQGNKVIQTIASALSDPVEPIPVRCSAAEAMGRLNLPENFQVDQAARKMGEVAAAACYTEIRRVEAVQAREKAAKESRGQMGSGGGYSPYEGSSTPGAFGNPTLTGAMPPTPLAYRISVTRRRLKHQVLCVRRGLAGPDGQSGLLAAAAQDPKYVQKVIAGVDALATIADNETYPTVDSLLADVKNQVKRFENECNIVVQLPASEVDPADALSAPMDLEAGPAEPAPGEPPAEAPATQFPDDAFDTGN